MEPFDFNHEVHALLGDCRTASLATADDAGRPHAANVQFAHDANFALYFVSSDASDHSVHIAQRPDVAMTVYAHDDRPEQIRGVQIHGRCDALTDPADRNHAWEVYTAKFAFVAALPMRRAVEAQTFYRVTPMWMRWIDNRRGFGWKFEQTMGS